MSKRKIYLRILQVLIFIVILSVGDNTLVIKAEDNISEEDVITEEKEKTDASMTGEGDVMGTSVEVVAPVYELDIKRIDRESIDQDEVTLTIIVENLDDVDKEVDKATLVVKNLDGTIEAEESINFDEVVSAKRETRFSLDFPNDLKEGKYIGVFELYSKEKLLGSSETILSVSPPTPEVLGVSTINYENLLLPFTTVFIIVITLSTFLFIKKNNVLLKGKILKLFDLVVILLSLSFFGLGISSGYLLCKIFYPTDSLNLKEKINVLVSKMPLNNSSDNKRDKLIKGTGDLILYTKPENGAEIKYELDKSVELEIIDEAAGWYRVLFDSGNHGWVRIEDIKKS